MDYLSKLASTDCPVRRDGQSVTILGLMTPTEFRKAFVGRVRQIRESLGWSPTHMAEMMNVEIESWRKYEKRTPLPHHLIPKFCLLTGVDVWYLFTGERVGKVQPRPLLRRDAK